MRFLDMNALREWLRQRLTPLGRFDRRCAREYEAMLERRDRH